MVLPIKKVTLRVVPRMTFLQQEVLPELGAPCISMLEHCSKGSSQTLQGTLCKTQSWHLLNPMDLIKWLLEAILATKFFSHFRVS
jgi:hypothetical protein